MSRWRWLPVVLGAVGTAVLVRLGLDRAAERLLEAPRRRPEEAQLTDALDALGGEVVRLRSRDGLGLSARWLPALNAEADAAAPVSPAMGGDGPNDDGPTVGGWAPDPEEAILLLHGWSGSVAPDLVEYGPFLRRTAGVLGLDFRGHGDSDPAPTTFGLHEIEDVAGALAWLAERGVRRVCLVGTSMGGMTAIAATVVLGDGCLAGAEATPGAPTGAEPSGRSGAVGPRVCGIVAESVTPELPVVIAGRLGFPAASFVARRIVAAASRRLGEDLRSVEPIRLVGLLEDCPLLLIAGTADATLPIAAARRLAAAAPAGTEWWEVDGADHAGAHRAAPADYEARVTRFLRGAFLAGRGGASSG